MGQNNLLRKVHIIENGDMSGDITSEAVHIGFLTNLGIQFVWTGTAVGSFEVQVSLDYEQDIKGNVTNTGTWIPLELIPAPVAVGSADDIFIDITQLGSPWIKLKYSASSGSGTLQGYVAGKQI